MKVQHFNRRGAFTVFEAVVVATVLLLLLAVLLPRLATPRRPRYLNCVNNLKQDGIAFRIWEGDNNDKYPMAVSVTNGGAQELIATGDVVRCFQVMSNELATPKLVLCPMDLHHDYATNFENFTRANISYFVGADAVESDPGAVMMGDANLVWKGTPVSGGIIDLRTNSVTWTKERHGKTGCVLLADGSVQTETEIGFTRAAGAFFATNRVAVR